MIIRLYVSSKLFHAETFIDFISDPFCGVSLLNKHQACANTTKTIPEFQRAPSPKRMQELRDADDSRVCFDSKQREYGPFLAVWKRAGFSLPRLEL